MNTHSIKSLHHIVIVGGGAGGLELAVRLGRALGKRNKAFITLVNATQTHIWKPLLHQVAAGTLNSRSDEIEYFALARANGFQFCLGKMETLNRGTKEIGLAGVYDENGEEVLPARTLNYDTLVVALGSLTNDFGTPGVHEHSIMLDTPKAAQHFHQQLINTCLRKQVVNTKNEGADFTITIIGGGATGVELSAELRMSAQLLSRYGIAHFVSSKDFKIIIIDAAPRLLNILPERLSNAVTRELKALDMEIHTNEKVIEVTSEGVKLANGAFIRSDLVVWAAGIKAPDLMKNLDGLETNKINQVVVHSNLETTIDSSIFAIGDCAACPQSESSTNVPPRAQAAHQQAVLLAKSLIRKLEGKPLLEFKYKDHGSLVSLGHYSTVGSLMGAISSGSLFIEGKIAKWAYWLLYKQHQLAINGWIYTSLSVCDEAINRVRNPRIKLH
ncbi:MAG: NAD(P)/FAD-dependent oxidoreductase [Pseudomonadota bacterium]